MTGSESERVAVIGLGSMGLGMASALLRAGRTVSGYDTASEACAKFEAAGGQVSRDADEACRGAAAVVVVVVTAAVTSPT